MKNMYGEKIDMESLDVKVLNGAVISRKYFDYKIVQFYIHSTGYIVHLAKSRKGTDEYSKFGYVCVDAKVDVTNGQLVNMLHFAITEKNNGRKGTIHKEPLCSIYIGG